MKIKQLKRIKMFKNKNFCFMTNGKRMVIFLNLNDTF